MAGTYSPGEMLASVAEARAFQRGCESERTRILAWLRSEEEGLMAKRAAYGNTSKRQKERMALEIRVVRRIRENLDAVGAAEEGKR